MLDSDAARDRITSRRRARRGFGIVAALIAVGVFVYWNRPSAPDAGRGMPLPDIAGPTEDDEPDQPFQAANPGFLGPQSCSPCHAKRVDEFMTTPHLRACRHPQDGPMPEGFESGRGRFSTIDGELQFEMSRSSREWFQKVQKVRPTVEPAATHRIDLVYGANKADEVFFSWKADRIHELMAVWLHPQNRWAHTSYDHNGSGSFARETPPRCLECHNTWIAHVPGTMNEYKPESAVLGVTCERCHGPGRNHVDFHQAHPEARKGHGVVHPGRLDRERRIEICTQCHGNFTKPRGAAFSCRAGEPLGDHYRLAQTRHPEDDHVANQIKYLRQSKCFQKSGTMTCVSCHDPHRPHDAAGSASSRKSCLNCHQPESCRDRPNLPEAVRDECIRCHMPQRVWMNVHFHTSEERYFPPIMRHQHQIAVDPIARREVLLEWSRRSTAVVDREQAEQLRSALAGHWLQESEQRRRDHRILAAIGAAREALRLELKGELRQKADTVLSDLIRVQTRLDRDLVDALHAAREQRVPAAIDTLERILQNKPDMAVAESKLGTLYAMSGKHSLAKKRLESVADHDPDNASGLIMLGWLAYLDNRPEEAVSRYARAVEIEPYDAKLNYHFGLALLPLRKWKDAEDRFRLAAAIEPQHAGAYQGLSHSLREQGRATEAIRAGRRAARLTAFENLDILVTLADAYAAAHRDPEAAATALKALERFAAHPDGPSLSADVRSKLERMRDRATTPAGAR